VLWLTQEESESQIKSRLESLEADLDSVLIPTSEDGGMLRMSLPEYWEYLRGIILDNEIGMVVVDPIQTLVSGNPNLESEVRLSLEPFLALCATSDVTVLGTRHWKKSTSGCPRLWWGTNSNAFASLARSIVHIEKPDHKGGVSSADQDIRSLKFRNVKLSSGKPDQVFDGTLDKGLVASIRLAVDDAELGKEEDEEDVRSAIEDAIKILDRCKDGWVPFLSLEAEAKDAGVGLRTLQKAKARLQIKSRRVVVNGRARWEWGSSALPESIPAEQTISGPWSEVIDPS